MLSQEIIVDMKEGYPFDTLQKQELPDSRIFVRRIIQYNSTTYSSLKERFDQAKKFSNPNIIRLAKVLQEQGRFHLLYEYIPFGVQSQLPKLSMEQLENLKMKLVYLSAYLFENRLQTEFTLNCIGLDRQHELKYYLSLDFKVANQKLAEVQNGYISQINRIHRTLMAQIDNTSTERKSKYVADSSEQRSLVYKASPPSTTRVNRRTDSVNYAQDSIRMNHQSREKSVTSNKTNPKSQLLKSNTMEMLNHIEMRLGELKITIKKSNTAADQPQQMRQSVKQRWNKHKTDNRKYSGEISYFSPIAKKLPVVQSPKSVRNPHKRSFKVGLENIVEASQEENNRKESTDTAKMQLQKQQQGLAPTKVVAVSGVTTSIETHTDGKSSTMIKKSAVVNGISVSTGPPLAKKSSDAQSRSSKMRQPKNKIDFQELKKNEFESFFNSQEGYVHEFLGVLGDDEGRGKDSMAIMAAPENDRHIENDLGRYKTRHQLASPRSSTQQSPNKLMYDDKRHSQVELRNRISHAIKQSNLALERYRKLSIHSISTEFGKAKRSNAGDVRAT